MSTTSILPGPRPRQAFGAPMHHEGLFCSAPIPAKQSESAPTATTKAQIRVLLVDDHPIVRKGLRSCLSSHEHLVIVGEAADGQEAVRLARELSPQVVLMDIDMPHLSGLQATEILRKELPHIKVLILSMHGHTEYVVRVIQSGASGYILKETAPDELVYAIESVSAGGTFFSPEVARVALNQFVLGAGQGPDGSLLTNREREVLIQIAKGLSNKEIATCLNVGVRTVETHRERIMRKLDIHTVAGLTRFALARGYTSLADDPPR